MLLYVVREREKPPLLKSRRRFRLVSVNVSRLSGRVIAVYVMLTEFSCHSSYKKLPQVVQEAATGRTVSCHLGLLSPLPSYSGDIRG